MTQDLQSICSQHVDFCEKQTIRLLGGRWSNLVSAAHRPDSFGYPQGYSVCGPFSLVLATTLSYAYKGPELDSGSHQAGPGNGLHTCLLEKLCHFVLQMLQARVLPFRIKKVHTRLFFTALLRNELAQQFHIFPLSQL